MAPVSPILYVSTLDGTFYALDASTGYVHRVFWVFGVEGGGYFVTNVLIVIFIPFRGSDNPLQLRVVISYFDRPHSIVC